MLHFLILILSASACSESGGCVMYSFDFEIIGKVQGVYFRKYTQEKAEELHLRGWVRNTNDGRVVGQVQGGKIQEMKHWLEKIGSPKSKIKKAIFTNEHMIEEFTYDDFQIIR